MLQVDGNLAIINRIRGALCAALSWSFFRENGKRRYLLLARPRGSIRRVIRGKYEHSGPNHVGIFFFVSGARGWTLASLLRRLHAFELPSFVERREEDMGLSM